MPWSSTANGRLIVQASSASPLLLVGRDDGLACCAIKIKFHCLEKQQQRALVQNNRGADMYVMRPLQHSKRIRGGRGGKSMCV